MKAVRLLVLLVGTPAHADTRIIKNNYFLPIDAVVSSPCTAEEIRLSGSLHVERHATVLEPGNYRFHFVSTYQNVEGVSLTSGTTYRVVDVIVNRTNQHGPITKMLLANSYSGSVQGV